MNVRDMKEQTVRVYDEPVTITQETINATCDWFAHNKLGCIAEAVSGEVFVNNIDEYKAQCLEDYNVYMSGDFEPGLWFWQRAVYIQTNQSVPILEGKA